MSFSIFDIPPQLCPDTYLLCRLVRLLTFSMVETLLPFKCQTQSIFLLWTNHTLFQSPATQKKWLCDSVCMIGFWVNSWRFWTFGMYLPSPLLPMHVLILAELFGMFVRKWCSFSLLKWSLGKNSMNLSIDSFKIENNSLVLILQNGLQSIH